MGVQGINVRVPDGQRVAHLVTVSVGGGLPNKVVHHELPPHAATVSLLAVAQALREMADALEVQARAAAELASSWGVPEDWT